jgi:DNA transposition AAA+ family ATPase
MELAQRIEIKKAVNSFCTTKGISKNELATVAGVSSATLSNLEYERWDMIKDATLAKIHRVVRPTNWAIVSTSNFEIIQTMCGDAQFNNKMLGLIGYTGAGKTTALKDYYHNQKKVYYMVGKKSMRPKRFFATLLRQMGVSYMGTIGDMIERIALEFNKQPDSLLIIDEAGKLDQTMFMYLHDLRDETIDTTGILLAGVEYFKTNLEKAVEKQKQGMPEFMGRITAWQELDPPSKNEAKAICIANGISDEKLVKELVNIKDYRQLSNQIINAKMIIHQSK